MDQTTKTTGLFTSYSDNQFYNLSVPIDRMVNLAKLSIVDDNHVWFAADVDKNFNQDKNLLSTSENNIESVLGIENKLTKKEKLLSKYSMMNHAMSIVGMNIDTKEIRKDTEPTKWKVENSWGTDGDNSGHITMSNDWFKENCFQISDSILYNDISFSQFHLFL